MDEENMVVQVEESKNTKVVESSKPDTQNVDDVKSDFKKTEADLKAKISKLEKKLTEVSNGSKEANELRQKLTEALTGKTEPDPLTPEQIFEGYKSKIEENFSQEVAKLRAEQEENKKLVDNLRKDALNEYREKLVAQSGGELVEDLLVGSSKEEIRENLEKAKSAYQKIAERFSSQIKQGEKAAKQQTKLPGTTRVASGTSEGIEQVGEGDVFLNMSDEDFIKNEAEVAAYLNKMLRG